jgi:Tfp pilus assembly protein PilF
MAGLMVFSVPVRASAGEITFNHDIAPMVFQHCANCHRPGQSGPFPLLTYTEVKAHGAKIEAATGKREMPPWLPVGEFGEFTGDRRLTRDEIDLLAKWVEEGMPEGPAADLPPAPKFPEGWQLGKPDLVVRMPKKYTLAASGRDIYRNFVIPVPIDSPRHVRAVELNPDNRRIVHHAFIKVDASGQVQRLDGKDGQLGFAGMSLPESVKMPRGYFLSYQPGKMPSAEPPGYGWTLNPGQDLVLQTHLRTTGKPEELQAQIGLYFTDIPPTNTTLVFTLSSLNIDIPPGTNRWLIKDQFTLPVDADVLAVLPHTHYLGKHLEGLARFADGHTHSMLLITNWDFNWQGDYRYAHPVHLPAGTTLEMKYVFDNSADHQFNPNQQPKEVLCGPQSSDEMAELWFQVRLNGTNDAARLATAYNEKNVAMFASYGEFRLERDPHDAHARTELGFTQWTSGNTELAMESFHAASADDPSYDQPHYYLGVIYRMQKKLVQARSEFETAIRLNPNNARAHGNLAFVFLDLGKVERAERSLREAVRLDPTDQLSREALDQLIKARATAASAN